MGASVRRSIGASGRAFLHAVRRCRAGADLALPGCAGRRLSAHGLRKGAAGRKGEYAHGSDQYLPHIIVSLRLKHESTGWTTWCSYWRSEELSHRLGTGSWRGSSSRYLPLQRALAMSRTVGDFVVQRLNDWGVRHMFGYPGDGINGVFGALGRNEGKIEFIQTRHEEMAAFMASAYA